MKHTEQNVLGMKTLELKEATIKKTLKVYKDIKEEVNEDVYLCTIPFTKNGKEMCTIIVSRQPINENQMDLIRERIKMKQNK